MFIDHLQITLIKYSIGKLYEVSYFDFWLHGYKLVCLNGFRTTRTLVPLESTIDIGTVTETTMQLLEEQDSGTYRVITDGSETIEIGHDLSLVLSNGLYSKP